MAAEAPPLLIIMGVSGSGKSTVAGALAAALGWTFEEGDSLHPAANLAKMRTGQPLDDADRAPWLAAIGRWIDAQAAAGEPGILTCSALKRAYRDELRQRRPQVRFVFLSGPRALLAERLRRRRGHFMPPSLLASQLATLQPPTPDERPIVIDVALTTADQLARIRRSLNV